jgi:hypothetical protein
VRFELPSSGVIGFCSSLGKCADATASTSPRTSAFSPIPKSLTAGKRSWGLPNNTSIKIRGNGIGRCRRIFFYHFLSGTFLLCVLSWKFVLAKTFCGKFFDELDTQLPQLPAQAGFLKRAVL